MKKGMFKQLLTATLIVVAVTQANWVSAHEILNRCLVDGFAEEYGTLESGAAEVWPITCSGGSDRLVLRVRDNTSGKERVSALVYKDGKALNTIDSRGGDASFSPFVRLNAGDGVYNIIVSHSLVGFDEFDLEFHCETNSSTHTTTFQPVNPSQRGDAGLCQ